MIRLKDIAKTFDSTPALRSVDLTIQAGMTTVLIGPSRCGKSSLLRLMIGLVRPDSGSVSFKGAPVTQGAVLALRTQMGYVIQEGGLFPHLTARDNVTLMARYLKRDDEFIGKRLYELADLTRFPVDGLSRFPAQLSGGQRQRVSLMRALMLDPDVLLLDEPLGSLDPLIRADLQTDLKGVFQTLKKTVVLVATPRMTCPCLGRFAAAMPRGMETRSAADSESETRKRCSFVRFQLRPAAVSARTSVFRRRRSARKLAATLVSGTFSILASPFILIMSDSAIFPSSSASALIGAGGYGQPILTGIRLDDVGLILQGAVPSAVLALLAQGLFELAERVVVPKGLRLKPVE